MLQLTTPAYVLALDAKYINFLLLSCVIIKTNARKICRAVVGLTEVRRGGDSDEIIFVIEIFDIFILHYHKRLAKRQTTIDAKSYGVGCMQICPTYFEPTYKWV